MTGRLTVAALVLMASAACAQNLALNRPYTMVPAPSYVHCTDEADVTQLTDGEFVGPEQFWIQEGCVGWKVPVDDPIDVVIDLGEVRAIDAIRFRSDSNPKADVYYPSAVLAVSDDGADFRVVARIDTREGPQGTRRWFAADDLATRGRYVLVRLIAHGVFVFSDEIEVRAGDHDPAAVELPDETIALLEPEVMRTPLQQRLLRDLEMIRKHAARSGMADMPTGVDEIANDTAALEQTTGDAAEAVEARVAAVHANLLQATRGEATTLAWVADPYAPLSPRELMPENPPASIELTLPRNAHTSAAVNVQNLTDHEVEVAVELAGLEDLVTLREARFIPTRQGNLLADALPLLDDGALTIPGRETRQVWLSVASREAPPEVYEGALTLGADLDETPIRITVAHHRLPDELPYATYSWQYPDTWPAIQEHLGEAMADLRAHHTNVTILSANSAPWPEEVDDEGNLTAPMDFTRHDEMVALCDGDSPHGIAWFVNLAHGRRGFDEFERFSEPWERLLGEWLRAWVAHLQEIGVGYDRFIFYPLDETIDEQFVEIARMVREIDPRIRIFADPLARDSDEVLRRALPLADVWCPNLDAYQRRPAQLAMIRDTGATIWSYTVGRRESDAYAKYRLHHWRAWRDGATGAGFWAYAQGGDWQDEDLWDDFSGRGSDYGVIYTLTGAPEDVTRAETIIPGKRWEAWREGVEDWCWLHAFDRAAQDRPDADTQRAWLAEIVAEVLAASDDPGHAARARERVLRRMAAW
ncbi:MAG: hypothetical protein GF393_11475 [Armatimonadia bacterium]|nr:hypothetical protein [Armatimonadia bacterium]